MRQEHETAKSFNQLKEIAQVMQAQKTSTQTSANTNAIESAHQLALNPKATTRTKKGTLNPTKKAFSERQITTIRDKAQANELKRLQTNQANNSNLREKPSDEALKPGLKNNKSKGGNNEA
ncbi:hypothetical protein ACLGBZ_02015 [Helicobacter pylori]